MKSYQHNMVGPSVISYCGIPTMGSAKPAALAQERQAAPRNQTGSSVPADQPSAAQLVEAGLMTGKQVKRKLWNEGSTLKEWAAQNGYSARLVSDVVRGVNRGTYGKGHEIAVRLGMVEAEKENA